MIKEITVPEIGEKVESGKVVSVLVKQGDVVSVDDGVIEFETDKAVVEIPAPMAGQVTEILVSVGNLMKIGDVIARIDTDLQAPANAPSAPVPAPDARPAAPSKQSAVAPVEVSSAKSEVMAPAIVDRSKQQRFNESAAPVSPRPASSLSAPASPSVRRLARELGVDIDQITGTGPGGRITDEDVKRHVRVGGRQSSVEEPPQPVQSRTIGESTREALPDFGRWGEIERVPVSTVRRITAESTAHSWNVIPHVTQFDKSDITHLQGFLEHHARKVEQAGGKLTVTAVLLKVLAEALCKYPKFNASLDAAHGEIVLKKYIHIGLAVDTDRGLLVPVIRDVDRKSILDLAVSVVDIAERARNKKIGPDEFEGGTFTISNQGGIGGTDFTPIVLWPQVAILGVSRASIEPKYIAGEFKPRTILPLSLSYDHRVIDGADAARFLRWVCDALENPFAMYLE